MIHTWYRSLIVSHFVSIAPPPSKIAFPSDPHDNDGETFDDLQAFDE